MGGKVTLIKDAIVLFRHLFKEVNQDVEEESVYQPLAMAFFFTLLLWRSI